MKQCKFYTLKGYRLQNGLLQYEEYGALGHEEEDWPEEYLHQSVLHTQWVSPSEIVAW